MKKPVLKNLIASILVGCLELTLITHVSSTVINKMIIELIE